jgi:hypothetical protein
MADDAAASGKKREAAMMLSAAEKKFDEEDFEECLKQAGEALKLFKDMGASGKSEVADAQRLMVAATKDAEAATKLATEEMEKFKSAGDKKGEGSMLLSLAEMLCDASGKGKKDKYPEAADKVKAAIELSRKIRR